MCGSPPRLSPQAYVERFKFQSITADDALNFFLEYFPELKKQGVDSRPGQCGASVSFVCHNRLASPVGLPRCEPSPAQAGPPPAPPPCLTSGLEFDRWLNTPGWPPFLPDLSPGQQLMKPADELAELWAAESLNMEAIEAVDITGWKTYQLVYLLDQLLQKSPLPEGEGLAPGVASHRAQAGGRGCEGLHPHGLTQPWGAGEPGARRIWASRGDHSLSQATWRG